MDSAKEIIHRHMDGLGTLTVESVQDCTNIAEACKARHNSGDHGSSELKVVGDFPEVFIIKYINDHNITMREFLINKEHMRRVAEDPALAHFRIWKGKL